LSQSRPPGFTSQCLSWMVCQTWSKESSCRWRSSGVIAGNKAAATSREMKSFTKFQNTLSLVLFSWMTAEGWDERYRRGEHAAADRPFPFLVEGLRAIAGNGRRALDLACGAGRHAVLLAEYGWNVTAVDWSEAALAAIQCPNVVTVKADLAGGFVIEPESWDLICISYYLDRNLFPGVRTGVRTGVRPEGYVAAAFPVDDERPGIKPMNPAYLLKRGELVELFRGFEILHSAEVEGAASRRRAELIARKPRPGTCAC
jgi:tellurite methyltransferase